MFDQQVAAANEWFARHRFDGIVRLYSLARSRAAGHACRRLRRGATGRRGVLHAPRELFQQRKQITTFGPYSPASRHDEAHWHGGIYLGDGPHQPKGRSQKIRPDLAAIRSARCRRGRRIGARASHRDKNQHFVRTRMTEEQRNATPSVDFRPFIIADADTGHGGDAHVRISSAALSRSECRATTSKIRSRSEEVRPPGRKVLVSGDEQIKRLNAARSNSTSCVSRHPRG